MKIQVYRTAASSYQNSSFLKKEQEVLESISGVKYINSLKQMAKDTSFILITNTHTQVEDIPEVILKKTHLMIHPNSGHDNIPQEFIEKVNFPIILGNPIRSHAVSEYVLSCLFKEHTEVPNHSHWSLDRTWDRKLLRDQKVLILGYGHIGKILASSLKPIVKDLKIYDPFVTSEDSTIINQFDIEMFDKVDVLIVAANLNSTSHQFINRKILNKLNPKGMLINPARGEIVKEDELIAFLQQNPKFKCYLDVFETEPFAPGYQNQLANLNKTSHIAGVFKKINDDIISFEKKVIQDYVTNYLSNTSQQVSKENYDLGSSIQNDHDLRVL